MHQRPSSIHSKDSVHPLIPTNTLTPLHVPKQTKHDARLQMTSPHPPSRERSYE